MGFDKTAHNKNLYYPNSRPEKVTFSIPTQNLEPPLPINSAPHSSNICSAGPSDSQTSHIHSEEIEPTNQILDKFITLSKERQFYIKKIILEHLNEKTYSDPDNSEDDF